MNYKGNIVLEEFSISSHAALSGGYILRTGSLSIGYLRRTGAKTKFLSLEPLLGPLHKMNLKGINWAIVGGESGPGARPLDPAWVADIRDQCLRAKVPFFFKQWGGVYAFGNWWKKKAGRVLEGRAWDEMPKGFSLASAEKTASPPRGWLF